MRAPPLREDLRLHDGDPQDPAAPCLVYDPIAHRYHELDRDAFVMLRHWRNGLTVAAQAQWLSQKIGHAVEADEVMHLVQTLEQAGLFAEPIQGWKTVFARQQSQRQNPAMWLLHNYLFIRVPLLRPDAFLVRTLPAARLLASQAALLCIAVLGIAGLYLTSRQWDVFTHTFLHFFSLEGAAGYLAALGFVKIFHEFGHAYVARHFGCRVPAMGIAFMVLTPVFYTDVSDAWRLPSRRQRMLISAAGMLVELAIASIATFLWVFLPEGFLKSACFFIATVSWVMSLAINLSPLMRFDGYYLLADFWRISNLQPRSFSLLRWQIRETLFNLQMPCPEAWPARRRVMVICYALAVCIYRLMLFIGIALFVYHATFKILGILLFAVEIIWFVLRPIVSEVLIWWQLRRAIAARKRFAYSLSALAVAVIALAVPWPHRVEMPAVIEPVELQRIAMPIGAKIAESHARAGQRVSPGDLLFTLESPKLLADIVAAQTQLDVLMVRRARRIADQTDRDATLILEQDIARLQEKIAGLRRLEQDLQVRATVPGTVVDLMPDLHPDRWASRGDELALIVADQGHQVRGYLAEGGLAAVRTGASGVFVPDEPLMRKLPVQLVSIGASGVPALDLAYLSSTHGGSIAVNEDREKGAVPVEAQYQVVMKTDDSVADDNLPVIRGVVQLDGTPESFLTRVLKRSAAILVRESGF